MASCIPAHAAKSQPDGYARFRRPVIGPGIDDGHRIGLTVRGKDYEYGGEGESLSTFVNVMKGCGPFLHNDPQDRPAEKFGGKVTLHAGGDKGAYLLLPIIPSR